MRYQHCTVTGETIDLPVGKVVCIGQNYQDHIAEMQSKTAPQALFFIKPANLQKPQHENSYSLLSPIIPINANFFCLLPKAI